MIRSTRNPDVFPAFASQYSLALEPEVVDELLSGSTGIAVPAAIRRAVRPRTAEYIAGRFCAREAIRKLEPALAERPVAATSNRAPLWAPGLLGSITHTSRFVSAVVARSIDALAIGLDAERIVSSATASEIRESIATQGEVEEVRRRWSLDENLALTTIFSAKEAAFKCLYPLVGRYFDFLDVRIEGIDRAPRCYVARLTVGLTQEFPAGFIIGGQFEVDGDHVHTGVVVPRERSFD